MEKGGGGMMVAGLGGGTGKSVVAVGLAAALVRSALPVAVFKKGPDYIDSGWLALAAGRPCYNLDPYLMSGEVIRRSFADHCRPGDLALLEGNRGLYDGVDLEGSCSSAELARLLGLPVLLVVDCTKTTRTVAAQVLGCLHFEQAPALRGVVLNRVGGARHEDIVRRAVEHYTGLPVLGALPRARRDFFPQRHLGVTPAAEHGQAGAAVAALAQQVEQYCDVERMIALAGKNKAGPEGGGPGPGAGEQPAVEAAREPVRIGYLRDAAFQFYYPDNLEALTAAGAELVAINALRDQQLPPLDGLYIGGGFPETSAPWLAANHSFRESVRQAAAAGLPIYAECGGLIYLGRAIVLDGQEYPLAGVFPVRFGLARQPQAHGYTELLVERENPFYPAGTVIRGHEFRYSTVEEWAGEAVELVFGMRRGAGFSGGRDGLSRDNVLALYTHIHALGTPQWAPALVAAARRKRSSVPEAGRDAG